MAERLSPSIEEELTEEGRDDWRKLQRLVPLNTGPRMLYVVADAPLLRRRLADELEAGLQKDGHAIVRLDFTVPYYQPLQEIFDQAAEHPEARFLFLFGLERSLMSFEHRLSALTDLNFHRDQVSERLPCPLLIWITDAMLTDVLINAPDFAAWRSGVFLLKDAATEREAPYRQQVIDQFGKLTLYSAAADAPLAVDLERVFVKLTTTQKSPSPQLLAESFRLSRQQTSEEGKSGPVDIEVRSESIPPPLERLGMDEPPLTLSLSEALQRFRHLAITGAPGAGKTTLLKYLALSFARRQARERLELDEDRIPIVVSLRDFAPFLETIEGEASRVSGDSSLFLRFLAEQQRKTALHLNLAEDFLPQQLVAGKCIVLLDGLDEVVDPEKRSRVITILTALARQLSENRWVVTSRPRGYEGEARQRLASLYDECTIRDFDDDDMRAFARGWYMAVTLDRRGDTPSARQEANERADDLLRAIGDNAQVKALAHNPLLLSVLAMVHQRGAGLPQRRAELYDECTDMLLGYWDQVKGGAAARELANLGGFSRAEKRSLLEPIALWFHERGEHGLEATKEELEEQVAQQFGELFGDKPEKARARAALFLQVIDERAGLLEERSPEVYAFAHLTFQEYLAARAIADREDYIAYTLQRLHKPWWREVILLEVGHLSDQRYFGRRTRKLTSDLLRAIRNAGSWLEDVLKRDLLFAVRCLLDTGPLGVEEDVRQSFMDELIALWDSTPYEPQRRQAEALFAYAMPTVDGRRIRAELLHRFDDQNPIVHAAAAKALGSGSAVASSPTEERLMALSADQEISVRRATIKALDSWKALGSSRNAAATPAEVEQWMTLSADQDPFVRWMAIGNLGVLGRAATPLVVERLMTMIADQDLDVRGTAALALGRLETPRLAYQTLADFWLSQLPNRGSRFFGIASHRVSDTAYQQLQHLAALREQRETNGETLPG